MLASSQVVAHATARAGGPSARAQARPAAGYVRPLAQLRGARGARFLAAPAPAHARRAVRSQAVRVSAIFGGLEKLIKGDPSEKTREKYQGTVAKINSYAAAIAELSDEQLRAKTEQFKQALANGVTLDSILPEAFAVRHRCGSVLREKPPTSAAPVGRHLYSWRMSPGRAPAMLRRAAARDARASHLPCRLLARRRSASSASGPSTSSSSVASSCTRARLLR